MNEVSLMVGYSCNRVEAISDSRSDDLPELGENIRKGFLETQTKVNKWISDFKKRIDGEDEEDDGRVDMHQRYPDNYGRRSGEGRRSGDRERYDADPRVLGDDFSALELRDNDRK
jgi:hypothetical protein